MLAMDEQHTEIFGNEWWYINIIEKNIFSQIYEHVKVKDDR